MIVAILAVLKTGAVYLPVDPELPEERLRFLLDDARPALLLDEADLRAVPASAPASDPTDTDRRAPLHPGNAAYVIYTSGSTGRPKGVSVEHRSLVNLLAGHRHGFVAEAGGGPLRVALTASFSFDTSLEGVLLMADGHQLHLVDEATRLDPAALVDYVVEHRVDFLDLTPSYLRQLLPAGLLTDPRHRPRRADAGRRGRRPRAVAGPRRSARRRRVQLLRPHRVHGRRAGRPHRRHRAAGGRDGRCATCAPTCSTTGCGRCRPGCRR